MWRRIGGLGTRGCGAGAWLVGSSLFLEDVGGGGGRYRGWVEGGERGEHCCSGSDAYIG